MRSSNPQLGEMTIKVPAPFAGITDLGLTVQYRAQNFNEPQRDVHGMMARQGRASKMTAGSS